MRVLNKLYKELRLEGKQTSRLEPTRQGEVIKNAGERLKAMAQEMMQKLEIIGSSLYNQIEKLAAYLASLEANGSPTVYKKNFCLGIIYLVLALLIVSGEFYLVSWTLEPFCKQSLERMLIASTIVILGVVAMEAYLSRIKKVHPESYQKHMLSQATIALIGLMSVGLLLAFVRAKYMVVQGAELSLTDKVKTAADFLVNTTYFPIIMGILAVVLLLMSGVALHEGMEKTVESGSYLRSARRHRKLNEHLKTVVVNMKEWEVVPDRGLTEFMRGFQQGLIESKVKEERSAIKEGIFTVIANLVKKPWFILLMALLIVFGVVKLTKADETESVMVLIDTSKSSLCKDYAGETEFQENILFVPKVIENLKPGSYLRVVGITSESFGKPCILMKGHPLPMEEGVFGEKTAKTKLALIEEWEKKDIKPIAKGTDIFGALNLASMFLNGDKGEKKLIILSDMRSTTYINLETLTIIDEAIINKVEKAGLIPNLRGVKIWALGVTACGKDMKYWLSLKKFWESFFKKSGANLQSFSIERKWN
jgi:hypothetical protein